MDDVTDPRPADSSIEVPLDEFFISEPLPQQPVETYDLAKIIGKLPIRLWRLIGRTEKIKVISDASTLATGDGQLITCIHLGVDGARLINAEAWITTVSSSGTPTVQIRNVTKGVDMLTTKITIDVSGYTSYTAAARSVVDRANNVVNTGDLIAIDVDVAGTGAKGLGVILDFQ